MKSRTDIFMQHPGTRSIATASFSSGFLKFIKDFNHVVGGCTVLVPESHFGDIYYGRQLASELRKARIKVKVFHDNELEQLVKEADLVVIGADAYNREEGVINGYPSRDLAEAAKGKIPVYVIAESYKLAKELHESDGYQLIPKELITEIFSDEFFEKRPI